MKLLDEKWYNVQLFKIISGVNVSRIEDARLIQKGLNDGVFSPSLFMFTSSWGDVTRKKSLTEMIFVCVLGLAMLIIGSVCWYLQESINDRYAKFDYKEFNYYISKDKMIITSKDAKVTNDGVHSRQDCERTISMAAKDSMFAIACAKLLNNDDSFQWWLANEIELNRESKRNLLILFFVYCSTGTLWLFSLNQFRVANSKVRAYMESRNVTDSAAMVRYNNLKL